MAGLADELGLAAMLAPLAGEAPCGVDLREDFAPQAPYRVLRNARNAARTAERQADANPEADGGVPAEWRGVRQIGVKLLTESSKDIEIAAWLTEALVRLDGLAGLTLGAQLIAGLARDFWNAGLLPGLEPDGVESRVSPVEGLSGATGDGTLVQPLRKMTLFLRPDGAPVPLWFYDQSVKLQGEADKNKVKARLAAGVVPYEDMDRDARAAGAAGFARLRKELRAALAAWNAMAEVLDAAAGSDSPSTGRVRTVLSEMLAVAEKYAPPDVADIPEAAVEEVASVEPGAASGGAAKPAPARENREDMLRELERIAAFFRRTEPHSPLAYTLDEAVRRGRLTLPELLSELVPDDNARRNFLTQLGIKM